MLWFPQTEKWGKYYLLTWTLKNAMTYMKAVWKQKGHTIMWSKTQVIFEANIFHLEPSTTLQVTDLTSMSVPGKGKQRWGKQRLTSSSPAGVVAGQGYTRAARTWDRAWRQTHGYRLSTARKANQRLRTSNQSETLSYRSGAIKLNTYFSKYLK